MGFRMAEIDRIRFIEQRDGIAAAKDFARRTLTIYREWARPKTDGFGRNYKLFPHDKVYRASFVESILFFRKYLRKD